MDEKYLAPLYNLQPSHRLAGIKIESTYRSGINTIEAVVRDEIVKIDLPLKKIFSFS